MNKSRDGFKSPFGFTVVHAIRKNFAFPLAVFVMSLALYLRSFFGSDKIRQLTALKSRRLGDVGASARIRKIFNNRRI